MLADVIPHKPLNFLLVEQDVLQQIRLRIDEKGEFIFGFEETFPG